MKTKRTASILVVMAALAVALLPKPAAAGEVVSGTFTLPVAARWGTVMLPAGTYHFSTNALTPTTVVRVSDESNPAASYFIMTQGWDQMGSASTESKLVLDSKDGEAYVKELRLGSEGTMLFYRAPKTKKMILAKSSPSMRIPASK